VIGRSRRAVVAVVGVFLVVILGLVFRRPILLMSPTNVIEACLMRELSPGTQKAKVVEFAERRGVVIVADVRASGERFIRMHLGYYRVVFRTDVVAFIRLDERDRVTRVDVQKHTDSL
jgi:hypothetical protein